VLHRRLLGLDLSVPGWSPASLSLDRHRSMSSSLSPALSEEFLSIFLLFSLRIVLASSAKKRTGLLFPTRCHAVLAVKVCAPCGRLRPAAVVEP